MKCVIELEKRLATLFVNKFLDRFCLWCRCASCPKYHSDKLKSGRVACQKGPTGYDLMSHVLLD